jgi:HEAT repeat protein
MSDDQTIEWALETIKSDDIKQRRSAIEVLRKQKSTLALPPLIKILQHDKEWQLRVAAAQLLGEMGDAEAIPFLHTATRDQSGAVVNAAWQALLRFDHPVAFAALMEALDDQQSQVRIAAVQALTTIKDRAKSTIPRLVELLRHDSDDNVRRLAGTALMEIGQREVVPELLAALEDENPATQQSAANALRHLADPRALEPLLNVMPKLDGRTATLVARALHNMTDEPIAILEQLLNSSQRSLQDAAGWALERLGRQALPSLMRAVRAGNYNAAVHLGRIGDRSVVSELLAILKENPQLSRGGEAVLAALTMLGGREAVDGLNSLLRDLGHETKRLRDEITRRMRQSEMDVEANYRVLEERALLFHNVLAQAAAYKTSLTEEVFLNRVGSVIQRHAQEVAYTEQKLNWTFLTTLPKALGEQLAELLPMNEAELSETFTRYALGFHQALVESEAYQQAVSEAEFIDRAHEQIAKRVQTVMRNDSNAALDLTLLALPEHLIYRIQDTLLHLSYDYEFGYRAFFEELEKVLARTSLSFHWEFDQKKHELSYMIHKRAWILENIGLESELDTPFYTQLKQIAEYLGDLGWSWCDYAGGDQVARILLVPTLNITSLRKYLVLGNDARMKLFYGL